MKNTPNISLTHLITPCKPPACSNTTYHHKTNFQHHNYRVLQVLKWNKILFIKSNQQYSLTFARMKNTPNISLIYLITPRKPPAFSNTTTHHKTNFQHHNYNAYKYWNQLNYYSSHLINKFHSHLQETKNIPNMNLNHLITSCKPLAYFNTTYHHKSNFQHHI